MIDGFKILNLCVKTDLLKNDLLKFPLPVNETTGEMMDNPRHCEYKSLVFTFKNNNYRLKGSFHKYFNNGKHNYNDYSFQDLCNTIDDLTAKFHIDTKKTVLNNLEFGVNIQSPYNIDEVFRSIVNYKGKSFQKFTIQGAHGIECSTSNFYIKIYDKSHHYKQPGNILRFEIKVVKMQYFANNNVKIGTLSSLYNHTEISKLKDLLLAIFNEILFTDNNILMEKLNEKERLLMANGNNPKYWEELKPDSKKFNGNTDENYKRQRKKFYRVWDKFKKLIADYSTSTMQKDIAKLIFDKATELLKIKKRDKFTDILEQPKKGKKGQIYILSIGEICPLSNIMHRICLTCGKDISHLRAGTKFCSKKCKNDYTNPKLNPKNNLKRKLKKFSFGTLFDPSPFVVLTEEQRALLDRPNTIKPTGT